MKEPVAIIKNGTVTNAEQLKRYWQNENERRYYARRAMFSILRDRPLKPEEPEVKTITRVSIDRNALELDGRLTRLEFLIKKKKKGCQEDYAPF